MRQVLSTALVAVIVSGLTVTVSGALAQEPLQAPPADVVTTGLNADTVDGRHAVSATGNKQQRRNKLVATDAKGYLPANIVKPNWPLIGGKPAAFADGQIGWNELVGIPGGFADGVDGEGVTGVKVKVVTSTTPTLINNGQSGADTVDCPTGYLAVGGGHYVEGYYDVFVFDSYAQDSDTWLVWGYKLPSGNGPTYLYAQATCLWAEPGGATIAAKGSTFGPARQRVRKP